MILGNTLLKYLEASYLQISSQLLKEKLCIYNVYSCGFTMYICVCVCVYKHLREKRGRKNKKYVKNVNIWAIG